MTKDVDAAEDTLLSKNKELFNKICEAGRIDNETSAAIALKNKGYLKYKNAQSVKNRFRSSATRTDFFWNLLDATDCHIEVVHKGEETREALKERISILENENAMADLINSDIKLSKNLLFFAESLHEIYQILLNKNNFSSFKEAEKLLRFKK